MAIVEVIKYNGSPDLLVWKYPNEELGTWTQLIVNESQEAVLFKGGKALDEFKAGRHTLDTNNIPFLSKLVNLPFGGKSPFKAEVWYVNKLNSLDIKWGTPSPIQIQDPKYNVFLSLRAFGQFGIQIEDSKKFLIKLVGTVPNFNKDSIVKYFRGVYLTKVKDAISTYLVKQKISILEINAYLNEISEFLKEELDKVMNEYGIKLINFYVNDINTPENDERVQKLKAALAKKAEMDIVGYTYSQERSFDTLEGAAKNEGAMNSGLMGAGIGLGIGVGAGQGIGSQFSNITKNLQTEDKKICPNCNSEMPRNSKFCSNCGFDTSKPEEKKNEDSAEKVTCSGCKAVLNKGMKFCPNCGQPVVNKCKKCGTELAQGTKFCHECGSAQ